MNTPANTFPTVPEKLTDADARALLEKAAPRARKISEDIVRNNTRAEQGQQQLDALKKRAKEHFGTDDPAKLQEILDERMLANANNVRKYLGDLAATEQSLSALATAAPGR